MVPFQIGNEMSFACGWLLRTWGKLFKELTHMTDKSLSVHIVSITAYLIGVNEEMFQREFKTSIYQLLETKPEAKIIRSLCLIRHALIRNYGAINSRLRNDAFTNLDKMPDYIGPAVFTYLSSQGISIIKTNPKTINYIITVNGLINDRIQACKHLYWTKENRQETSSPSR